MVFDGFLTKIIRLVYQIAQVWSNAKSVLLVNAFSHVDTIIQESIRKFIETFKNQKDENFEKVMNFLEVIFWSS